MIYSEKIVEEAQNGNKSNTGSVYAIYVTAKYEESESVEVTKSSSEEEEYDYMNGFFIIKSHNNLLSLTTDD